MNPPSAARSSARSALVLAIAFAFFAWRSWRTWPDILVDFGHELYIPWRLVEGDVLYRDLPFTMGPLSQYFNTLLFRLFGVSLNTLIGSNLAILAAIVGMLFWLFRRIGTAWSATVVLLFFLVVFAFAQYSLIGNYNYVCPYRHEITHGLALGLAELVCLTRWAETRRIGWLVAAGSCLGLVGLTKLELLVPAGGSAVAALVLNAVARRNDANLAATSSTEDARRATGIEQSALARDAAWLGIAASAPIALAVGLLAIPLGWSAACAGVFGNWLHSLNPALTRNSDFYRAVSGLDRVSAHFTTMLHALTLIAVGIGAAFLADRFISMAARLRPIVGIRSAVVSIGRRLPASGALACLPAIGIGMGAAIGAGWCVAPQEWSLLPAPMPLLLPIVISVVAWQVVRDRTFVPRGLPLCLIAIYGLLLLPKILLHVRWSHYGFALAMPGMLTLVHVVVYEFPEWLRRRDGSGRTFRAVWVGVLTLCAFVQFRGWDRVDQAKTQRVGDGGDQFYADPRNDNRVLPVLRALVSLRETLRPEETLCVIPEGATLNYLLRKSNPTGHLILNPWEFDLYGEEKILAKLTAAPPSCIVYLSTDMAEFGRGQFGSPEFGGSIRAFIEEGYVAVHTSTKDDAPGMPPFQAVVYRRRLQND